MSQDEVLPMICAAIAQIQKQSGRAVELLTETSCPFKDVDGFDSLNGEEVTALLLEELSFGPDFNPFAAGDEGDLTIGEIANRLAAHATTKQEVV
jgi:hypothetical protein